MKPDKAIDHFMAHGPSAADIDPPMLHAGTRLPADIVAEVGALLVEEDLVPEKGYLAG